MTRVLIALQNERDYQWNLVRGSLKTARRLPEMGDVLRETARVHMHLALAAAAQLRRVQ